jgi:hypothetical protein
MPLSLYVQLNGSFTTPPSLGRCRPGAPYSDEFERHQRVFVVGEHDDTFVYHLHLGINPLFTHTLPCIGIKY